MLKQLTVASVVGAVIALTGCQSTSAPSAKTLNNLAQLENRTWIVTHIGNTEVKTAPEARNVPSLQFDGSSKRVAGADGCNRLMGNYAAGTDTLSLSQMAGTQMACLNNDGLDQKFNTALNKVTHYQVFGQTLKLTDSSGNPVLQLQSPVQPR